jgi:mycofactocin biosynthesis protein MftB
MPPHCDHAMAEPVDPEGLDLAESWSLSPLVALRLEPFGALAYHFGNRRLVFLRRPEVVTVVRALDAAPNMREALLAADIPARHWPAYAGASQDHSRRTPTRNQPVLLQLFRRDPLSAPPAAPPLAACAEHPLAGFTP